MDDLFCKTILDVLRDAIFILDAERHVLYMNPAAEERFGTGLAGRDFVRVTRHPDCLEAIEKALGGSRRLQLAVTLDQPARADYRLVVADLRDGGDADAAILLSFSDISELREAEKMRSDFVANVSHELRSPLTALAGFVETLKTAAKDDPDARERFLALMEREAQRMIVLIADLLSLSSLEARQRIRPDGTANLGSILSQVKTSLADLAAREAKTVELELADMPDAVPGSPEELTQVFQNLLENAIKYGAPQTVVRVTARRNASSPGIGGPVVAIAVSDQSEGIAKEHIPRLTERFYRADTHRSRDKGGTGLGLAIVKHIVSRHRGRLTVASEQGKGSTFTVFLPMEQAGAKPR